MYARAGNILLSLLGACVFWLYAFALRVLSSGQPPARRFSFGRIGHHCDTHDKWPTVPVRSLCLTWFSFQAALCRLLRWILQRLFGAVFCRQVVDLNHNIQVNNL